MNLIRKTLCILFILIGIIITTTGYVISFGAIPNPTTNQWFDALLIVMGAVPIIVGCYRWRE